MLSVIFDMDGTLLDTQRICIDAWDYAGNLQGIKNMGSHIYKVCGMNEVGWTGYLSENFPNLDIVLFKKEMREYIVNNLEVKYKQGAEELLTFLKQNNVKIALASGTSRPSINHHLKKVGATDFFDAIVGGGDVKNGKPAPDVFLKAAELIDAKPEECFVFEDSANGIKAAHKAGMKCIGIPDIVSFDEQTKKLLFAHLDNMSEAVELFKKLI